MKYKVVVKHKCGHKETHYMKNPYNLEAEMAKKCKYCYMFDGSYKMIKLEGTTNQIYVGEECRLKLLYHYLNINDIDSIQILLLNNKAWVYIAEAEKKGLR